MVLRAWVGSLISSHPASAPGPLPLRAFGHFQTPLHPALLVPLQVKCDQYWPVRGTETYGLIQVTLLDTVELATYTVRTFALHKVRACPTLP